MMMCVCVCVCVCVVVGWAGVYQHLWRARAHMCPNTAPRPAIANTSTLQVRGRRRQGHGDHGRKGGVPGGRLSGERRRRPHADAPDPSRVGLEFLSFLL